MTHQAHELHGLYRNSFICQRDFTVLLDAFKAFQWYSLQLISPNNGREWSIYFRWAHFLTCQACELHGLFRNLYIHQCNFTVLSDARRAFQRYPLRLISPNTSRDMINLGQVGEFHDSSGTWASQIPQEFIHPPMQFYGLLGCTQSFSPVPFTFNKS